ncbi:hypothetical protein ANN_12075 [Periplaneta americana]|uniref:Uncharacterized protein n=1 Tax=Periplaneta americana TaxID=6978 RepID=A0ABQ8T6U9_PERAM|nr:hypothetical protein ANN_12075 [Periplaneta americana]
MLPLPLEPRRIRKQHNLKGNWTLSHANCAGRGMDTWGRRSRLRRGGGRIDRNNALAQLAPARPAVRSLGHFYCPQSDVCASWGVILRRFINSLGYLASEDEDDNASKMSPGFNTENYPAFAHVGLRENPEKTSTSYNHGSDFDGMVRLRWLDLLKIRGETFKDWRWIAGTKLWTGVAG